MNTDNACPECGSAFTEAKREYTEHQTYEVSYENLFEIDELGQEHVSSSEEIANDQFAVELVFDKWSYFCPKCDDYTLEKVILD